MVMVRCDDANGGLKKTQRGFVEVCVEALAVVVDRVTDLRKQSPYIVSDKLIIGMRSSWS